MRPGLDDKILADWNGLMIAALVHAATMFHEPEWIALAARAYAFIADTMQYTDANGQPAPRPCWRAGVLVKPGLALDHAAMMRAALALMKRAILDQRSVSRLSHRCDRLGGGDGDLPPRSARAGFSP